jgi:hypothetical protein
MQKNGFQIVVHEPFGDGTGSLQGIRRKTNVMVNLICANHHHMALQPDSGPEFPLGYGVS